MRNRAKSKIGKIIEVVKHLPIFTLDDLASIEVDKKYLRIVLARQVKTGILIRLKKGVYVTKDYLNNIEKFGRSQAYAEFLANALYEPSYLSLEYVLHKYNIITESPMVITSISRKKTSSFKTLFGTYKYHSITPTLFIGFTVKRDRDYIIFEASMAKALFDFLYFRKNHLLNNDAIKELRLNLKSLKINDKKELEGYIKLEGSVKLKNIYNKLWKN